MKVEAHLVESSCVGRQGRRPPSYVISVNFPGTSCRRKMLSPILLVKLPCSESVWYGNRTLGGRKLS